MGRGSGHLALDLIIERRYHLVHSKLSDDPNSGVISFEVDKVSTLDCNSRYSSEIEVGGMPWLVVYKQFTVKISICS